MENLLLKSKLPSTIYKNNSRFGCKFKCCSPLQLSCKLTGMKPLSGYYSYTKRYKQTEKNKKKMKTTIYLILTIYSGK